MHVVLKHPAGEEWRVDTPDPHFIGDWLKSIFDSFEKPRIQYVPVQFTLEISR